MFYANTFTLKMENKKMAAKALEVMREALAQIDADGFKYDSRKTVDDFANDLMVKGSEVIAAGSDPQSQRRSLAVAPGFPS